MTIFSLRYLYEQLFSTISFTQYGWNANWERERIHKLQENPTLKRQQQMAVLGDSKRAMPRQKLTQVPISQS